MPGDVSGINKTTENQTEVERGNDVLMRVAFKRHAKYDSASGHLSAEGKTSAQLVGEKLEPLEEGELYLVKGYSSEFDRTKETASEILGGVASERKGQIRKKSELGTPKDDFFIADLNKRQRNSPTLFQTIIWYIRNMPIFLKSSPTNNFGNCLYALTTVTSQ